MMQTRSVSLSTSLGAILSHFPRQGGEMAATEAVPPPTDRARFSLSPGCSSQVPGLALADSGWILCPSLTNHLGGVSMSSFIRSLQLGVAEAPHQTRR